MNVRLDKLLSNRGYCSRREVRGYLDRVREAGHPVAKADAKVDPADITWDGEPLDAEVLLLLLHKPAGYTCSHKDVGPLVLELFPERFNLRNPVLSPVGRLDRDTTGALLFTDDGELLHRLTAPRYKVDKVYEVWLDHDASANDVARIAAGGMQLDGDDKPLLPAHFEPLGSARGLLTLTEGRYHHVKRLFEALGNQVVRLHRHSIGELALGELVLGAHRALTPAETMELRRRVGL